MENKFSKARELMVKKVISEMIYLGFLVLFSLNFTNCNNIERFVVLGLIEVTFVGTKVYCKIQDEKKMKLEKERKEKKNDRS